MDVGEALQRALNEVAGWGEALVENLPNIVAAILVFLFFWLAARLVSNLIRRALRRASVHENANRLLARLAAFAVIAVGLFAALGILNLNKTVTSLLAGAGIVGLALGFAAQDSAENLIAGILISLRRPFMEGHLIESKDFFGTVEEVNLRSTIIRTPQGQRVYLPNSTIYANPLVNYSELGWRRVDLSVGVSYGDDLAKAREAALGALADLEVRDRERDVELFYEEFGGSSINFQIRFWIDFSRQTDYLAARSEAVVRIKEAFEEADITIPFPIRTLDFGIVGGVPLSKEIEAGRS